MPEVDLGYDAVAHQYDAWHGDEISVRRFARIEADMLRAANAARVVLEIGVGTGRFLSQVRAPQRIGVDPSPRMLDVAQARAHDDTRRDAGLAAMDLRLGDAHALPVRDASVDVVVAPKGVFRYLRWEAAFAEVWRVLVPGGQAFVHQYRAPKLPLRQRWSLNHIVMHRLSSIYEASDLVHVREIETLASWEAAARGAGFAEVTSACWRPLRIPPYVIAVPCALPAWSHVVTRLIKRP
ncbi:MAG: class I SAM-dependent methyltransferase [Myxococcales bacterium]|nr:class I SAM-dependent methyltransferase [Myxococcales bacterium]